MTYRIATAALLAALAAGCMTSAEVPDETIGTDEAALQNTGRGPGGNRATCSAIKCPDDELNRCFVPCVTAGGTAADCTTACGCTKQTWTCNAKVFAQ